MKTLKCDLCDHEASGETFEEWMNALKPHYAKAHVEFMKQQTDRSEKEQEVEMQKWAAENKARFDAV